MSIYFVVTHNTLTEVKINIVLCKEIVQRS